MGKLMRNGEEIGTLEANITYSAEGDTLGDATAADVVAGKTFSSSNGVALTGTLPNLTKNATITHSSDDSTPVIEGDQIYLSTNSDGTKRVEIRYVGETGVIKSNTLFGIAASNLGDATAANVVAGKTFTSSNGIAITGTAKGTYSLTEETKSVTYNYTGGEYGNESVILTFSNNVAGVRTFSSNQSASYLFPTNIVVSGKTVTFTMGHHHGTSNIGTSATLSVSAFIYA